MFIDPNDIQIDTYRIGKYEQKVNETATGVRIIHHPTGIVVKSGEERSMHKNKKKAMEALRERLFEIEKNQQEEKE